MAGNFEILGIGELSRKFSMLTQNMKQKTARKMVAAAGGIVRKEAKSLALQMGLKKTGSLIRNIAIKRERSAGDGVEQYNLGVRHGRELRRSKLNRLQLVKNSAGRVVWRRVDDPFYWRFLEFGTKSISPHRFLQKSLENKRQAAIDAMMKRLDNEMQNKGGTI